MFVFFFFKHKTAYELRISDWSSDVCSSDLNAALALPSDDWLKRINTGEPFGPVEAMLAAARGTVYARDAQDGADAGYGLETEMAELDGALVEAAQTAAAALDNLLSPLPRLGKRLEDVLADAPDWLDGAARARVAERESAVEGKGVY